MKKTSGKEQKNSANVLSFERPFYDAQIRKFEAEISKLQALHKETCEMAVRTILRALDHKDHYTYGHSMRVAHYALILGEELGFSPQELYNLELASICHDIGKIGVPDAVLLKPSRLDAEEMKMMQEHPGKSYEIIKEFNFLANVADYVRFHHERIDGTGYPQGLAGEEIPLVSRIILVADTFDAMTSSRPYRKGLTHQAAIDELVKFSGTQFDGALVSLFLQGMEKENQKKRDQFYLQIVNELFNKDAA
ncbi:MAG: hypothetical protein A2504_13265 [Bdellovibrionales bacterium RIFOXYD12_FULL_39_22]|nr:MAG: hypothetical protein A2385_01065 [Bdellovibrionales bacterium RIFOXYB1_FULL_39_21]OFZ43597.1 MAG: hypothetical protein A2485_12735 [Bdellovibrionales bacterium RIFOXYC12_FULL_39_17]OFZ44616.1 MAG: hypothetical protein A2404_10425 [Bdellovibrionales bacterium RIFOXYC1_FULL_39_130]OFZ76375.1 MAG: hypothetical protein A2560_07045 [Bdellovibrionales bacterium RIFOXYD1_FULL_39_84]OFZ94641.1 MAG: hypothetical protein A2504_13265 [Bdellovibrionales bacterium RIFOXYD12_FULL_39_22]HLE12903.1 HD